MGEVEEGGQVLQCLVHQDDLCGVGGTCIHARRWRLRLFCFCGHDKGNGVVDAITNSALRVPLGESDRFVSRLQLGDECGESILIKYEDCFNIKLIRRSLLSLFV